MNYVFEVSFYEYPSEKPIFDCGTKHGFTCIPRMWESIDLHTSLDENDVCVTGIVRAIHWETVRGMLVVANIYVQPVPRDKKRGFRK